MSKPGQNINPLQYGMGYRQQGSIMPGRTSQGAPLTPLQQVQQQQAQHAQQQAQGGGQANLQALAQALAAKTDATDAERFGQRARGAFMQKDTGKSAALGGLNSLLANRKRKSAIDAANEAAAQQATSKQDQLKQQAKAAAQLAMATGANQDQADAVYASVLSGMDPDMDFGKDGPTDADIFGFKDKIRDDAKPVIDNWNSSRREMKNIEQIVSEGYGSGSAQVGALYSLVKGLDPDSVVREGEVALAQQAESLIGMFQSKLEKLGSSAVMSESLFNDLMGFVTELNRIQRESFQGDMTYHLERADQPQLGLTPESVFGESFMREITAPVEAIPFAGETKAEDSPPQEMVDALPPNMKIVKIDGQWKAVNQ